MADRANRTEKPTPKRLSDERQKGNVARSKELPGAMALAAILVFAHLFGSGWMKRMTGLVSESLAGVARPDLSAGDVGLLLGALGMKTAGLLAMPLGMLVVAAVGGNLVQAPPVLTLKPLQPDLKRINPFKGIGKVFRLKSWVEMLKTALKMALFTTIAVYAVREAVVEGLPGGAGAEGTLHALFALSGKVILRVAMLAFGLAVLDWLFTRYDHTRQLMMTRQEIKEERRQHEGDPMVKARIRSKQMALARSRMMADVSKATVVITNPTHFAVALRYVPGETDVPRVLAKGQGKIAQRIREVAIEHRIPVLHDPPLARALFRLVEVGGVIPERLYRAVAEVLALILRKRGRSHVRGEG